MHKRWRRGRPPVRFPCLIEPRCKVICPVSQEQEQPIILTKSELEILRLLDYEGFCKKEVAEILGCSRVTIHKITKEARKKIIKAILEGRKIIIEE